MFHECDSRAARGAGGRHPGAGFDGRRSAGGRNAPAGGELFPRPRHHRGRTLALGQAHRGHHLGRLQAHRAVGGRTGHRQIDASGQLRRCRRRRVRVGQRRTARLQPGRPPQCDRPAALLHRPLQRDGRRQRPATADRASEGHRLRAARRPRAAVGVPRAALRAEYRRQRGGGRPLALRRPVQPGGGDADAAGHEHAADPLAGHRRPGRRARLAVRPQGRASPGDHLERRHDAVPLAHSGRNDVEEDRRVSPPGRTVHAAFRRHGWPAVRQHAIGCGRRVRVAALRLRHRQAAGAGAGAHAGLRLRWPAAHRSGERPRRRSATAHRCRARWMLASPAA